ncbi:MAG: DUF2804 domain-containing protein [Anaerolineaceae bacterium]|nr:DUF2804 domain-containing protein [Anaerolineaceae bacterium]MBN2678191.1 DUF2804 domain-containing protein [Anaerolineaceae bacterium]
MPSLNRPIDEKELLSPVRLCNENGGLNPDAIGWSRIPLTTCNLSRHPLRKKRWNYWAITTPDLLFSITISNVDYLGMVFAYFLDIKSKKFIEKTRSPLFGNGCNLPEEVFESVSYTDPNMSASFTSKPDKTSLCVRSLDFGGLLLDADIQIHYPANHQTMSVVIPWSDTNFQYTSKHNCLPATGSITLGDTVYPLSKGKAFACLDYGRGIWPYKSQWNWASFSGKSGGQVVGINLGAGWTDGTGLTENSLTYNGVVTKLSEDVVFDFDTADYMKPWLINSCKSDRIRLTFTPIYERIATTNVVILTSSVHQMFGYFNGSITPEGHRPIRLENLFGWAEDHHARW